MSPGIWQFFVILAVVLVVVLIFGSKNIRNLGADLGGFIKGFRNAIKDDPTEVKEESVTTTDQASSESKS